MARSFASLLGMVAAPALIAIAAGCSCGDKTAPSADARDDVGAADGRVDLRPVDARGPDLGKPGGCGGERTLSPIVIPPKAAHPCGPGCKQVSWGASSDRRFEVADDILVYVNLGFSSGIYIYHVNLGTGVERRLHADWPRAAEGCDLVSTDGSRIATTCVRDRSNPVAWTRSVTVIELASNIERDIYCRSRTSDDGGCSPTYVNLTQHGVALQWTVGSCGAGSAYYLPFGKSELTNLAGITGGVFGVNGQGNKVVWSQPVTGYKGGQIMVYDLDTGKTKHVDPHDGDQWMPRVQGDKIVWTDHRNDPTGDRFDQRNSDIYLHDLSTGQTTAVTTHPALQEWPDVWGDWVVWHDLRANPGGISGGNIDVYAKNMTTGQEHGIATTSESESYPRIDRDRIFYRSKDVANSRGAIFMVDLAAFLAAKKNP